MKAKIILLMTACGIASAPLIAQDPSTLLSEVGVRIGQDAEKQINLKSYELYSVIDTDWSWELSQEIRLALSVEATLGGLSGEDKDAVYARIAPLGRLQFGDFPVSLEFSSGPSYYSEDRFSGYDIGGNFHFTSSLGLNWTVDKAWKIGYRFQHTSNADLDSPNPGLDMHTLSVAYIF
tara:strand:- start:46 stop:579 length:534 start_codon:yes stop_codon:yes gene_type:complete